MRRHAEMLIPIYKNETVLYEAVSRFERELGRLRRPDNAAAQSLGPKLCIMRLRLKLWAKVAFTQDLTMRRLSESSTDALERSSIDVIIGDDITIEQYWTICKYFARLEREDLKTVRRNLQARNVGLQSLDCKPQGGFR